MKAINKELSANRLKIMPIMLPINNPCKGAIDFSAHEKTFEQAVNYIWDYVDRYPGYALSSGGGAEICRDHLSDLEQSTTGGGSRPKHCGLMLYFCCQNGLFFLAWKFCTEMDESINQFPPFENVPYYLSNCEFLFEMADITSKANLTNSIRNYLSACPCEPDPQTVLRGEITNFGDEFLNFFGYPETIIYPVGFFHRKQIQELLQQNNGTGDRCIGIRFYWGYKDTNSIPPGNDGYKLKLVAFGIKPDGGNVITNPKKLFILEHSWPPY